MEACRNGVDVEKLIIKQNDCSIYASNRRQKFTQLTIKEQMIKFGLLGYETAYSFYPNCAYFMKKMVNYYFSGLIANVKILSYKKPFVVTSFLHWSVSRKNLLKLLLKINL